MKIFGYDIIPVEILKKLKDELKHEKMTNKRLRTELQNNQRYLKAFKEAYNARESEQSNQRRTRESNKTSYDNSDFF